MLNQLNEKMSKSALDRCDDLINDYEALLVNEQVSLVFQEDVWELKKEIKNIIRDREFVTRNLNPAT